ncbi:MULTISPECIES: N-acetyltransferase [unclassified Mesotoga]|uniref:GNAT family N-acetyltransferase n=1 Tax=unclassified Mesotoga TaxID=1184398 RepID=UPI000DA6A8D9|nr:MULTISPECIES: GNAT family N-acetyltransferase [unclassified Mesotoga]PZC52488.1 acetyltransferase [Mesotoga sp. TolDC]
MQHKVRFEEITEETVLDAIRLSGTLLEGQERAVASNAVSIAQAHFAKNAWFRAIYAGDEMVGFIMLDFTPDPRMKDVKHASIWRFMIGGKYQKMGYGRDAILLLIEYLKAQGYEKLFISCAVSDPSPLKLYLKLGFVDTGEWDDDEKILMRDL